MSHPDSDILALAALGEHIDEATLAHLRECPQCGAELDRLRRVVRAAHHDDGPLELSTPSEHVWGRIAKETGVATTASRAPLRTVHQAGTRPSDARRAPVLVAAAAGLILGATGGGVLATVLDSDQSPSPPTPTLATADLEPLSDEARAGTARVVEQDGNRVLSLTLPEGAGARDSRFREVWLLDTDQQRLVSLGVLEGSSDTFALPSPLDLSDYSTVDVSAEPFDGDPAHSGASLVRGDLTF